MKYSNKLKQFLAEYEQYEQQVLMPMHAEAQKLLASWQCPEYWRKYSTGTGVATPCPIRMALSRIKHPDKVVDKIFRKSHRYPQGLAANSIYANARYHWCSVNCLFLISAGFDRPRITQL